MAAMPGTRSRTTNAVAPKIVSSAVAASVSASWREVAGGGPTQRHQEALRLGLLIGGQSGARGRRAVTGLLPEGCRSSARDRLADAKKPPTSATLTRSLALGVANFSGGDRAIWVEEGLAPSPLGWIR